MKHIKHNQRDAEHRMLSSIRQRANEAAELRRYNAEQNRLAASAAATLPSILTPEEQREFDNSIGIFTGQPHLTL